MIPAPGVLCKYVIPGALLITIGAHLISGVDIPRTSFIPGTHPVGALLQVEGVVQVAFLILIVCIISGKYRK